MTVYCVTIPLWSRRFTESCKPVHSWGRVSEIRSIKEAAAETCLPEGFSYAAATIMQNQLEMLNQFTSTKALLNSCEHSFTHTHYSVASRHQKDHCPKMQCECQHVRYNDLMNVTGNTEQFVHEQHSYWAAGDCCTFKVSMVIH